MKAQITHQGATYHIDLSQPIDLSLPFTANPEAASAWYVAPVRIEPVKGEGFVGDVQQGGAVNFRNITFNPHGNGTHTESVGHISEQRHSVNKVLDRYFFVAEVISIEPEMQEADHVITKAQLQKALGDKQPEALIIRTLPNSTDKATRQYSNTNFTYLHHEGVAWLVARGLQHLLVDLPSVDRESDEGKLLAHRAFWQYPESTSFSRTITEFVFVPDSVPDGRYLLQLSTAPFENDATPSRPILYKIFIGQS